MFEPVKALLDRAAPLLVDSAAGKHLVALVSKYVEGDDLDFDEDVEDSEDTMEPQDEISERGRKALDLLLVKCFMFFVFIV